MDYNLLKYFHTVCEEGSLASAAKKLFISSSALSQAIKQLETEVGYPLFDRVNNRLKLNDYGKEIKKHSELIIRDFDNLRQTIDQFDPLRTSLKICSDDPSSIRYYLPIAIEAFPKISFSGTLTSKEDMKGLLLSKAYDIGFSLSDYHTDQRFYSIPFGDDRMYAYIPDTIDLANRDCISISDLDGLTLLLTNIETTSSQIILKLIDRECSKNTNLSIIDDYGAYRQILATSKQCVSFVSSVGIHYYNEIPFRKYILLSDPELRQQRYLVYLKENQKKLSVFLDWIKTEYSNIMV